MKNVNYLAENKIMYLFDTFEQAVFKFDNTKCFVKFKGKKPYEVETSTSIAMEALLGGKIITKDEYDNF